MKERYSNIENNVMMMAMTCKKMCEPRKIILYEKFC